MSQAPLAPPPQTKDPIADRWTYLLWKQFVTTTQKIPAAAGAPTDTPTNPDGQVTTYYDTTNNHLYVYNGGWKKVALT